MYITQHVIIESLCGFMVMKRNLIIRLPLSMANQYVFMEFLHGTLRTHTPRLTRTPRGPPSHARHKSCHILDNMARFKACHE